MPKKKYKLTEERPFFKPFSFEWAFEAFKQSEQMHWLPQEVPLLEDVKDWKNNLSDAEKYFLTNIFRFFTQADVDVAGGYVKNYLPYFPQPEVRMMLCSFAAREAIHIQAYSHLIETLGMPESTYNEFFQYEAMKEKHEYFKQFHDQDVKNVAQQIAAFSAFTEGMQLFSSFVMLLNFARNGKMKGMGQIIAWSIADEAVIEGTEVLTSSGWKKIENLNMSDQIYQFDMDTRETSFVNPAKIQHVVRDESYIFESDNIHQHVSPGHRMIVEEDGKIVEYTAENCPEEPNLIISGQKVFGESVLCDDDIEKIKGVISGEISVEWLYEKLEHVSKDWARAAIDIYLSNK